MDNAKKKDLINRYISRQLSPDELDEFFKLIEDDEASLMPEVDEIPQYYDIDPGMEIPESILSQAAKDKTRYLTIRNVAAVAAAILFTFVGIKTYQHYAWYKLTQTFATLSVPKGTMKTVLLSDSSSVSLTSGSVFRYPMAFGKSDRRVMLLEGKAFFHVKRDTTRPFTVESGKLQTTALGTSFTVERYSHYGYEKVNLYTGKVRVNNSNNKLTPVILHPGDEVKYETAKDCCYAINKFDATGDPLNHGSLVFEKTPFNEALYRIASYYGVDLKFDEKAFRSKLLTGEYNFRQIDEVLRSIAFVYQLKINRIDHLKYSIMQKK